MQYRKTRISGAKADNKGSCAVGRQSSAAAEQYGETGTQILRHKESG
jgi:hypothetical protein